MGRKRKVPDVRADNVGHGDKKVKRNRASSTGIYKLYEDLTDEQIKAVTDMEFESMLDIKCPVLHNGLNDWLAGLYQKESCEFVIPGRGRIPLNERTIFRSLGLPIGDIAVVYGLNREIESVIGPILFPDDGNTPKISRVFEILKSMSTADDAFKQIFIMFIMCTVIRPTTCNKVSSRCYPVMGNISNVHKMNWAKFVADQLHEELSNGKFNTACLCLLMLLYVDSIDISALDVHLPEGRFAVNIWSKEDIDTVLAADVQADGKTYGKLQLKSSFGFDYSLFGGVGGFNRWIDTYSHPSCSSKQRNEVSNLMGTFVTGLVGLMGSLVGSWTQMLPESSTVMADQFGSFTDSLVGSKSTPPRPAGRRAASVAVPSAKGPVLAASEGTKSADSMPVDGDDFVSPHNKSGRNLRSSVVASSSKAFQSDDLSDSDSSFAVDGLDSDDSSPDDGPVDGADEFDSGSGSDDEYVVAPRTVVQDPIDSTVSTPSADLNSGREVNEGALDDADDSLSSHPNAGLDYTFSPPRNSPSSDFSPIPEASASGAEASIHIDKVNMAVSGKVADLFKDNVIEPARKNKLQTMRQKHNLIVGVVASELLSEGIDIHANSDSALVSPKRPDLPRPKKMTPKRKQVSRVTQPTRSSPRFSAEKRPVEGGAVSSSGPVPTLGLDLFAGRKNISATYKRKKSLKMLVQPSRTSPRFSGKSNPTVAATTSVDDVVVRSTSPAPDIVVDADIPDAIPPKRVTFAVNTPLASQSLDSAPLDTVKQPVVGSLNCPLGGLTSIISDVVRTCASMPVDDNCLDTHKPETQAPPAGLTDPSASRSSVDNTLQDKIDEVASKNGGIYPARLLFDNLLPPMWNFTSRSPVAPSPPQSVPSENVVSVGANAAGPSGLMYNDEAGTSLSTDDASVAGCSILDVINPSDELPLSFAMPTSTAPNAPVACANVNSNANHAPDLISLDDLVFEKSGVQNYCSTSKADSSRKTLESKDVQVLCTPAMLIPQCSLDAPSITPRSRIRMERVIQPSKFLLPPYFCIRSTAYQDALYRKVIIHTRDCEKSKLRNTRILQIGPMWVTAGELADSMKPDGLLSSSVVEIGLYVLQQSCSERKVIFPWIAASYLLDHKFNTNVLKLHFRRDEKYKLSHKNLLSFPVLQKLGSGPKAMGHFYMLSLNMVAKRFEILDSLRGPDDDGLIDHATRLMDAIKAMYLVNYGDSNKHIQDYELMYIPTPKQDNTTDCGFFMLKFIELWDGRVSPAISADQIPAFRKLLTARWLEHKENKLTEWKSLFDNHVF